MYKTITGQYSREVATRTCQFSEVTSGLDVLVEMEIEITRRREALLTHERSLRHPRVRAFVLKYGLPPYDRK